MSANKRHFSSQQLIYQIWALLCTETISDIIALKQGKAKYIVDWIKFDFYI
jgi:hypothetical protein